MMGLIVIFLWVPAHIGIRGNEMADGKKKVTIRSTIELSINIGKTEKK